MNSEEHYQENLYVVRRLSEHKIKRDPNCSEIWKRNKRNTSPTRTLATATILKMPNPPYEHQR